MTTNSLILPPSYRNFALIFLVSALIVLTSVFYLVWARVTIIITPVQQTRDFQLRLTVVDNASSTVAIGQDSIVGIVRQYSAKVEQSFSATGQQATAISSNIVGEVTIFNKNSQNQVLVATTRLATAADPKTVLARLKNTVTVPAGGSIKVPVYTDSPEQFKSVASGQLIIPGLLQSLWTKIYAQNDQALILNNNPVTVATVTSDDLAAAKKQLTEKLYDQLNQNVNKLLIGDQQSWPKLIGQQQPQFIFDVEAGSAVAAFSGSVDLTADVVVIPEQQVIELVEKNLNIDNTAALTISHDDLSYNIEQFDATSGRAVILATAQAVTLPQAKTEWSDKNELLGKTTEEIQAYYSQFVGIKSVEVKFSPNWLKKTPRLASKIDIQVNAE